MVGLISETIKEGEEEEEEEDLDQPSKPKTSKDPLDCVDTRLNDLSFADSFLDFDSIEDWFEDIPTSDTADLENINFGAFGKGLGMVENGRREETHIEGQAVDESGPNVDGSCKSEEGGSAPVIKVDPEEWVREQNSSCCIEEEMQKVNLVGCSSSGFDCGTRVKSEAVSNEEEMQRVKLVDASALVSGSDPDGGIILEIDAMCEGTDERSPEPEDESSSSATSSNSSSSDDDEEEEEVKEGKEEMQVEVEGDENEMGEFEEGEIRYVDVERMLARTDNKDEEEEEVDDGGGKMVSWSDIEFDDVDDEDVGDGSLRPIRTKNEFQVP